MNFPIAKLPYTLHFGWGDFSLNKRKRKGWKECHPHFHCSRSRELREKPGHDAKDNVDYFTYESRDTLMSFSFVS